MSFYESYKPDALIAFGVDAEQLQPLYERLQLVRPGDTGSLARLFEFVTGGRSTLRRVIQDTDGVATVSIVSLEPEAGLPAGLTLTSDTVDESGAFPVATLRMVRDLRKVPVTMVEVGWGGDGFISEVVEWTRVFALLPHLGLPVPDSPDLLLWDRRDRDQRSRLAELPGAPPPLKVTFRCFRAE